MKVTDEQIIYASQNSRSAAEAARMLGVNYKTYKTRAEKLGIFKTNQFLPGVSKPHSRIYNINDTAFSRINDRVAYWLGFIAADGSVVDNTLKFMLQFRDVEILQNFFRICGV